MYQLLLDWLPDLRLASVCVGYSLQVRFLLSSSLQDFGHLSNWVPPCFGHLLSNSLQHLAFISLFLSDPYFDETTTLPLQPQPQSSEAPLRTMHDQNEERVVKRRRLATFLGVTWPPQRIACIIHLASQKIAIEIAAFSNHKFKIATLIPTSAENRGMKSQIAAFRNRKFQVAMFFL